MITLPGFNGDLVLGINECTYQDVIDDFRNSSFIGIVTYNISARNNSKLLQALKSATQNGTQVEIITNIPKRFPHYYGDNYAIAASEAIKKYIRLLNPQSFDDRMDSYFLFSNHAKIIVTDNIAYWGSANFSDESDKNYECGTISTDPSIIKYIKDEVLPQLKAAAIPYYKHNFVQAVYKLREAKQMCQSMSDMVHEATFVSYEDYDTNFEPRWVYNKENSGITKKLLESFIVSFRQYVDALAIIDTIVSEYWAEEELPYDVERLNELADSYKKAFSEMQEGIEDLFDMLDKLSRYDVNDEANYILENKYGMEAWDESLDHYAELAVQEAQEYYEELIEDAEPVICEILDQFTSIIQYLSEIEEALRDLLVINRGIDNTGVL
jgi:hypothetical protein